MTFQCHTAHGNRNLGENLGLLIQLKAGQWKQGWVYAGQKTVSSSPRGTQQSKTYYCVFPYLLTGTLKIVDFPEITLKMLIFLGWNLPKLLQ